MCSKRKRCDLGRQGEHDQRPMRTRCAVWIGAGLFGWRRSAVVPISIFVHVLVMSKMLARLARLMHAIGTRHPSGYLENECNSKHEEKAFEHVSDYNSLPRVERTRYARPSPLASRDCSNHCMSCRKTPDSWVHAPRPPQCRREARRIAAQRQLSPCPAPERSLCIDVIRLRKGRDYQNR